MKNVKPTNIIGQYSEKQDGEVFLQIIEKGGNLILQYMNDEGDWMGNAPLNPTSKKTREKFFGKKNISLCEYAFSVDYETAFLAGYNEAYVLKVKKDPNEDLQKSGYLHVYHIGMVIGFNPLYKIK